MAGRPIGSLAVSLCLLGAAAHPGAQAAPPQSSAAPATLRQGVAALSPLQVPVDPEYRIRPGDVLTIKFFYNPELNETVPVRPDGRISLELVDETMAAGRTPAELRAELLRLYEGTLKQPQVAVIVKEVATRQIYIGGEVNTPGLLRVEGRLTLVQGLVQAGGLRRSGQMGNVVVLRYQGTDSPKFMKFDIEPALKHGDARADVALEPFDIVWVPKTRIARVNDFMDQYIRQVMPVPLQLGLTYVWGGLTP